MIVFSGCDLACIRGERIVFANLAFRVEAGGALVLRGPNGSGKSSLLRLMAGLSRPAHGTLDWGGEDIRDDPAAHGARVHYVGHLDAVKPVLTVFEQLTLWAEMRGMRPKDAAECGTSALETLGIAHLADVPGRYLSAGQRRRVGLCRLLTMPGLLWLLDEPQTALDDDAVRRLSLAIQRHRENGGMVILSLHGSPGPDGSEVLDLSAFALTGTEAAWC